jgi:hypothetical protein
MVGEAAPAAGEKADSRSAGVAGVCGAAGGLDEMTTRGAEQEWGDEPKLRATVP